MSTAFSRAVSATVDILSATPKVADDVFRAASRPIPEKAESAVTVRWVAADPDAFAISGSPVDWSVFLDIECYARSKDAAGDLAVDPVIALVYERIAANPTLDGTVDFVGQPGLMADEDEKGTKTGYVRMRYPVRLTTSNGVI